MGFLPWIANAPLWRVGERTTEGACGAHVWGWIPKGGHWSSRRLKAALRRTHTCARARPCVFLRRNDEHVRRKCDPDRRAPCRTVQNRDPGAETSHTQYPRKKNRNRRNLDDGILSRAPKERICQRIGTCCQTKFMACARRTERAKWKLSEGRREGQVHESTPKNPLTKYMHPHERRKETESPNERANEQAERTGSVHVTRRLRCGKGSGIFVSPGKEEWVRRISYSKEVATKEHR